MKCNVGKTDKIIRILIGIVILILGYYYRTWWGLIGLYPLITGVIAYCPISNLLGISTSDTDQKQPEQPVT